MERPKWPSWGWSHLEISSFSGSWAMVMHRLAQPGVFIELCAQLLPVVLALGWLPHMIMLLMWLLAALETACQKLHGHL